MTNILINYTNNTENILCFCSRTLENPPNSIFNVIMRPTKALKESNKKLYYECFLVPNCIRKQIYISNLFQEKSPYIFWIDSNAPFLEDYFAYSLQHSLIIRRLSKMDANFKLTDLTSLYNYIIILLEESLMFFKENSINKESQNNFSSLIKTYYKNAWKNYSQLNLGEENLANFSKHLNPIIYYNIFNTKDIQKCLSLKGLNNIYAECKDIETLVSSSLLKEQHYFEIQVFCIFVPLFKILKINKTIDFKYEFTV